MNSITQLHEYGCAVACVAFATNRNYMKVAIDMGVDFAQNRGFYCRDIVDFFSKSEIDYEYHHIKQKSKIFISAGTFVFIKRSKRYPAGHWVFKHKGLYMDPWINFAYCKDITKAKSGFRKRLPGQSQWVVIPTIYN